MSGNDREFADRLVAIAMDSLVKGACGCRDANEAAAMRDALRACASAMTALLKSDHVVRDRRWVNLGTACDIVHAVLAETREKE